MSCVLSKSHELEHPIDRLQLIFKVVERCNINCTYCYYFNKGDQSALKRPARVTLTRVREIGEWVKKGVLDFDIPSVNIVFHGGEPLMMSPADFGDICAVLIETLGDHTNLSLVVQTNGTILSERWLNLFKLFGVEVGISIDGDKTANDRYRIDFKNQSTHSRVAENIKSFAKWSQQDGNVSCGTISVLDAQNNYREQYRFLRALGVRDLSFLLPDRDRDDPLPDAEAESLGVAYHDIFCEWIREGDASITVRQVDEMFQRLPTAEVAEARASSERPIGKNQIVVARSDGTLAVDDSLMPASAWYSKTRTYSASASNFSDFLQDERVKEISALESFTPTKCKDCKFLQICGGGDVENRYSSKNGFDNPSVYCSSYKIFYSKVIKTLSEIKEDKRKVCLDR